MCLRSNIKGVKRTWLKPRGGKMDFSLSLFIGNFGRPEMGEPDCGKTQLASSKGASF